MHLCTSQPVHRSSGCSEIPVESSDPLELLGIAVESMTIHYSGTTTIPRLDPFKSAQRTFKRHMPSQTSRFAMVRTAWGSTASSARLASRMWTKRAQKALHIRRVTYQVKQPCLQAWSFTTVSVSTKAIPLRLKVVTLMVTKARCLSVQLSQGHRLLQFGQELRLQRLLWR